ncbi:MAG: hypothetical protein FJ035_07080, partial [Chloroflexi bacterium]|nr:hypothetical protein [Chloroflexota bacterium]
MLGRADGTGATFALHSCATTLDPLRRDTFAAAAERARSLAEAAGVTLGPLLAVAEQRPPNPHPLADPCDTKTMFRGGLAVLHSLDTTPQVRLNLELRLTYRIAGAERSASAPTVAPSGAGQATAPANAAYVVLHLDAARAGTVQPQQEARDRAAFVDRIVALGLRGSAVSFATPATGGAVFVLVEVPLAGLPKLGDDIVEAAARTVGRPAGQGVWFTHTDCAPVRNAA